MCYRARLMFNEAAARELSLRLEHLKYLLDNVQQLPVATDTNNLVVRPFLEESTMSDLIPFSAKCQRCQDTRWICERHPLEPEDHDDCHEPGVPCPCCNTGPRPEMLPGWKSQLTENR
jgi:hypothetical protein